VKDWQYCESCDSEFRIDSSNLEQNPQWCPFCGEELEEDEEQDDDEDDYWYDE